MITQGLLVELLVDGTWTDITSRVMVRDTGGQITISRGQSAEGQAPDPGTATFQLNNRDGLFSPANPMSAYYGLIGRNTQLRISVARSDGARSYRFWGEVPEWPEDWDMSGNDVWVDITAAGILRRLNQGGNQVLQSTLRRRIPTDTTLVGYWPMEDGKSATQAASALSAGQPMVTTGLTFAEDDSLVGSGPLPTVADGARLYAVVPRVTDPQAWRVELVFKIPTAPGSGSPTVLSFATTTMVWTIGVNASTLTITGVDKSGTSLVSKTATPSEFFGQWNRLHVQASQGETTVNYEVGWTTIGGTGYAVTGTYSGTAGQVTNINTKFGTGLSSPVVGHFAVFNGINSAAFDYADMGFDGETVGDRLVRLAGEQSVNFVHFSPASADLMGPQLRSSFLALVQECVDVDQGILMEREDALGLAYKSRGVLYNQSPAVTLSYPGHQLSDIPRPVPDDQRTRNDITVSRPSGSSAQYTKKYGSLSVDAVGSYPDSVTVNVHADSELASRAAWRVHSGTVDAPRYPAISVNLANSAMDSVRDAVLDLLFGARLVVADPPGRLGGDISQLVIGIRETLTYSEHQLTFVGAPADPYVIGVVGDSVLDRVDTDGSELATAAAATDTTLSVAVTAGPLWRTTTVNYPLDVAVAGEVVTVTAVSGSSSPQTFTVVRGVNGVVKALPSGSVVGLATPSIVAL